MASAPTATDDRSAGAGPWKSVFALGVLAIAVGAAAIALPAVATVSVAILIGWLLILGSVLELMSGFFQRGFGSALWRIGAAVLMALAGVYLVVAPLRGSVTLTVVLAAWFILVGLVRLVAGLRLRGTPVASGIALNGAVSLLLGLLIALKLPSSAAWAIGLLVGVDFLFAGATIAAIALAMRRGAVA